MADPNLHPFMHSNHTRKGAQRAPLRLQQNRLHAPPSKPIANLVQPRQRRTEVAPAPAPEHLGGRRGARTHNCGPDQA
jgi:hypothetical protein